MMDKNKKYKITDADLLALADLAGGRDLVDVAKGDFGLEGWVQNPAQEKVLDLLQKVQDRLLFLGHAIGG